MPLAQSPLLERIVNVAGSSKGYIEIAVAAAMSRDYPAIAIAGIPLGNASYATPFGPFTVKDPDYDGDEPALERLPTAAMMRAFYAWAFEPLHRHEPENDHYVSSAILFVNLDKFLKKHPEAHLAITVDMPGVGEEGPGTERTETLYSAYINFRLDLGDGIFSEGFFTVRDVTFAELQEVEALTNSPPSQHTGTTIFETREEVVTDEDHNGGTVSFAIAAQPSDRIDLAGETSYQNIGSTNHELGPPFGPRRFTIRYDRASKTISVEGSGSGLL